MSRLILALVLTGSMYGLASSLRADDSEDRAINFVVKLGGKITRDDKSEGKPVVELRLNLTQTSDADLKELAALKSLSELHLNGTPVTDTGLKELVALKNLTVLNLRGTQVTAEGVKERETKLPSCAIYKDASDK